MLGGLLCAWLWFGPAPAGNPTYTLPQYRAWFQEAANHSEKLNQVWGYFEQSNPEKNPIVLAYWGGLHTLKGRDAWNPVSKLHWLKSGMALVNQAVSRLDQNAEIRHVRFSVESKVPRALGFREHVISDKQILLDRIAQLPSADEPLSLLMVYAKTLLSSGLCTNGETAAVNHFISAHTPKNSSPKPK
jgi:hypothetical protein